MAGGGSISERSPIFPSSLTKLLQNWGLEMNKRMKEQANFMLAKYGISHLARADFVYKGGKGKWTRELYNPVNRTSSTSSTSSTSIPTSSSITGSIIAGSSIPSLSSVSTTSTLAGDKETRLRRLLRVLLQLVPRIVLRRQ